MQFTEIEWQSDLYDQEIQLRLELLRIPLRLTFSDQQLQEESSDLHFGMLDGGQVVACAVIVPLSHSAAKLRQMAVATTHQKQGIGTRLVKSIESTLRDRQFQEIELHARDVALGFYERLGYRKQGSQFIEVGIPHWRMTKSLRSSC